MDDTAQAIHASLHHLSAVYARESDQILLEQFGIGFSQYKILSSLQTNPALRQKHIAFELGQTEASISRQVKLLMRKGMLEVRINPSNRREHNVILTPRGERIIEAAQAALHNYHTSSLAHISSKDQVRFLEFLVKVHS